MADKLTHLEQVKRDAERITLRRIREAQEEKAYQESQVETTLTMDDSPVAEGDVYSTRETKTGKIQYLKNGKLTSKAEYEANVN